MVLFMIINIDDKQFKCNYTGALSVCMIIKLHNSNHFKFNLKN